LPVPISSRLAHWLTVSEFQDAVGQFDNGIVVAAAMAVPALSAAPDRCRGSRLT